MLTVQISNEFLHGPIWVRDEDGLPTAEGALPLVEDDPIVNQLAANISSLFDSYYEFDSDEEFSFDEKREKDDREKMLDLLRQLRERLDEINDGSFSVDDMATGYYKNL